MFVCVCVGETEREKQRERERERERNTFGLNGLYLILQVRIRIWFGLVDHCFTNSRKIDLLDNYCGCV